MFTRYTKHCAGQCLVYCANITQHKVHPPHWTLCWAMFSVAGDGVNLRGPDTGPGGNEMSVYSAEYFTLLMIFLIFDMKIFLIFDMKIFLIREMRCLSTLQNILLCSRYFLSLSLIWRYFFYGNEMSVNSAEYFTLLKIFLTFDMKIFLIQDLRRMSTLQNMLLCWEYYMSFIWLYFFNLTMYNVSIQSPTMKKKHIKTIHYFWNGCFQDWRFYLQIESFLSKTSKSKRTCHGPKFCRSLESFYKNIAVNRFFEVILLWRYTRYSLCSSHHQIVFWLCNINK